MNKFLSCVFIAGLCVLVFSQAGCEFSFGEKQEPIFNGTANPGVKPQKKHTPAVISEVMTEDLTDRGWKKKPTAVYEGTQKVAEFLKNRKHADIFKYFTISSVTQIPYYNDVNSKKTVTLTFYDAGTPFDAFSIFSMVRQEKMEEYIRDEREMVVRKNSTSFWEGPYFVTVKTTDLGEDTRDILFGVSKGIAYKLYGLLGTYTDPDITDLFPTYQQKANSVCRVLEDPFQLPPAGICMKAQYTKPSGKTTLYILSDSAPEKTAHYRKLLLSKFFIDPKTSILATVRNKKNQSYIWVNSPEYGIVEVALKNNILAVQVGLGTFKEQVKRIPGLKEMALSATVHRNLNTGVDLNTYKDMLVISKPGTDANDLIMTGVTEDVMREVKEDNK